MTARPTPAQGIRYRLGQVLDYLPNRVIPVLMALIVWLVAGSANLQVVALFTDATSPLALYGPAVLLAVAAVCLFAIRSGTDNRASLAADVVLFALPVAIIALRPPWSEAAGPVWGVALIWAVQLFAMFLLLPRRDWDNEVAMQRLFGMTIGVFIVLYVLLSWDGVGFARFMGSLSLFAVFLGLLMVALSILRRWRRMAWAVAAAVVVSMVFFEFQHEAVYRNRVPVNVDNEASADPFALWLFDRADAAYYRRYAMPYPVILAASEGGGGYAMAHSYAFLSKMTERCPNFAQHLFALVGVSGGQIGNTLYQANLQATNPAQVSQCGDDAVSDHAEYLATDHLSPLLGHLMFVEIPRKLLFLGAAAKGRTRALLESLNRAPADYAGVPDVAYSDHFWERSPDGGAFAYQLNGKPALVSVTANVQTGNRFVFSPFEFETLAETNWEFFRGSGDMQTGTHTLVEPDLGSVTLASASFPWVTPSLRFTMRRGFNQYFDADPDDLPVDGSDLTGAAVEHAVNLVDGGYFENSGAETLSEIMASISHETGTYLQRDRINQDAGLHWYGANDDYAHRAFASVDGCDSLEARAVPFMQAGVEWGPCEMPFFVITVLIRNTPQRPQSGAPQSFLRDPVTTLLQARSARGELAIATLEERRCGFGESCALTLDTVGSGDPNPQIYAGMFQSLVDSAAQELPLGWNMPRPKVAAIGDWVVPRAEVCAQFEGFEGATDFETPYGENALHPKALDLLVKRNCSHLRQMSKFFDAPEMAKALEWRP
ncbi:DUF998 domain-containing protein [Sulfitobacter sp. 20_GPM-1509m]|uniref:DUF998 domain-containing protein n=1 Tax=Sulfitobacter sp. 20_GPM-1509m TaxID=1380367 RepID=UPI00056324E6|nr:DUF998 domain-containing protein [Sulfitobacter sp. 20_GPM-1509m]